MYESKKDFNLVLLLLQVEIAISHRLLEIEQVAVMSTHLTFQFLLIQIRFELCNIFVLINSLRLKAVGVY